MKEFKWTLKKDKAGEYRAQFQIGCDVILATEGFARKDQAQAAIDRMKKHGPDAPVEDNS